MNDSASKHTGGNMHAGGYLHAGGVAYLLYFCSVAPVFCFSLLDLETEWEAASGADPTDPAQHVAMGQIGLAAAFVAMIFFLMAAAASLYVLWRGSRTQRLRIAAWYGTLFAMVALGIYGPAAGQFPMRVYFSLYQMLLQLPLLVLHALWLWRDRRRYVPARSQARQA